MAGRHRYLLAYDVRHPRRLRHVHRVAKDFGHPLQYSVFVCDLTREELVRLRANLAKAMNLSEDSVSLFDLGPPRGRGVECTEYLGVRPNVPDSDKPAIW